MHNDSPEHMSVPGFLYSLFMIQVGEIRTTPPDKFRSRLQEAIYMALDNFKIPYHRVDTDEAISMEDCEAIDRKLDVHTVKTVFLCNRQQSLFYLFVMMGNKPFVTKEFSKALGVSRVSFAPAEMMFSIMGMPVGGASVLSAVTAPEYVRFVIDKDVMAMKNMGCNDGTPFSYLKIATTDMLEYLRRCGVAWYVI